MKRSKRPIDEAGESLYLQRAENELILAKALLQLSQHENLKRMLNITPEKTFYSNVISTSYFAIFYGAKAYLLSKGIKSRAPQEHKKTYERFSWFIESGVLDRELRISTSISKSKPRPYSTYSEKRKENAESLPTSDCHKQTGFLRKRA